MIVARVKAENPEANLKSYYESYRTFSWSEAETQFYRTENGLVNIFYDAVEKWALSEETSAKTALVFENGGKSESFTFADLLEKSSRWANVLSKYNFKVGDRIFIFLPTCPELYFAAFACARLGVLFSVLYASSASEELEWRLNNAEPRGIVTDHKLIRRLPQNGMENVKHVFLTSGPRPGLFTEAELEAISEHMPREFETRFFPPETPLYIVYTSGSTGPPKGVVHAHQDMVGIHMTAQNVLDLNHDSILWTDAQPAWVTGAVYGTFAPWLCGATALVVGDNFTAANWYRILEKHRISNWYTTPMTLRKIKAAGLDLARKYDLSSLKHIATVGEALEPELFYWVRDALKHSPHDTWWMTETGMICIANFPSQMIKPGSMGRPVPGIEAAVIDPKGETLPILSLGELALKADWPSMMRGIWRDESRYNSYFKNGWFVTGDMVMKDEDGYYYHQGRNDDLIKLGDVLIGPYDLEQVLSLHPAVAESVVISKFTEPNSVVVKGFVRLNYEFEPSDRLIQDLKHFIKLNFYREIHTLEIEFIKEVPKTRSGKILRRALRARELGLPIGDPKKLRESY